MSVKYGILSMLFHKDNHGYDLKLEVESLLGMKGKINPGQIYTTLDRLIRDDLVCEIGMDEQERKIYQLLPKGEEELKKWLLEPVPYHSTRDDFHFKWSCARRVSFVQEPHMLEQQKQMIMKDILELTQLKTEFLIEGDENRYLSVSGTLLHLEADVHWINQIENRNRT